MWTHRKIARIVVIGGVRGVQRARSHRAGGCWILLGRLNSRTRRGGLALRGRFLNILSIPKIYKVTKGSPRRRIQRRSRLLKRCFHPRRP